MKHSLHNGLNNTDKENKMAGSFGNGRTTGGITGSGGNKVNPIYKPITGSRIGPAKIQGPQLPEKKSPSIANKIIKSIKEEMMRPTHRTL
jgi:hypothetical protein